jgi:hypothetical protein
LYSVFETDNLEKSLDKNDHKTWFRGLKEKNIVITPLQDRIQQDSDFEAQLNLFQQGTNDGRRWIPAFVHNGDLERHPQRD